MSDNQYKKLSKERKQLQKEGLVPEWFTTGAYQIYKKSYAYPGEKGVLGRHQTIARTLSNHLPEDMREEFYEKFLNILWKGWLSPASPVLSNTGTTRGMPVSCSGGVVGDSVDSFYTSLHEQAILTKNGFGCSAVFSDIRSRGTPVSTGGTASGVSPVVEDFATMASKINQGMRRGATASYIHADHEDFDEVCDMVEKHPDGLNIGWIITDAFTEKLREDDDEAQRRYNRILYCKMVTGKGYLFFIDKVNRARPQVYKDFDLLVKGSNLCNEIRLYADDGPQGDFDSDEGGHTFTCVLSSMNVAKYDEWKDTDAVFVATVFLDCVVSEFLERCYGINGMQKAYRFTKKSRPIGLGQLGIATYFQSKMIPYESLEADYLDYEIQKHITDESARASRYLAELLGEPLWCKGSGFRNSHRTANAPNKTSSQLMGGISESFSADPAMIWVQNTTAGDVNRITPEFLKFLKSKGKYNKETEQSIINAVGSCQHLEWMNDVEKAVFKTGFEMDQGVTIRRTARRQTLVDQGQSLNIYCSADGDEERINEYHEMMFDDENIHGAYYVYSQTGVVVNSVCVSCEG